MTRTRTRKFQAGWCRGPSRRTMYRISEDMAAGRGAETDRTSPKILSTWEDGLLTSARGQSHVTDVTHS